MKKKELGQFFTTNVDYILQGFEHTVKNKTVVDPFAGNGDLLSWAKKHGAKIHGYDIDKSLINHTIHYNDSLINIPPMDFCLTNPPYLGKNKMTKSQKSKYPNPYEDLYLLSIQNIINANPNEGIIIIPINFLSAENSDKLRTIFLDKYQITNANYFTNQVFSDTTYNVVAFHFIKQPSIKQTLKITSFPDKTTNHFTIEQTYAYKIAGKSLDKIQNAPPLKIQRLTEQHIKQNQGNHKLQAFFNDKHTLQEYTINRSLQNIINRNIILLNCIDTNNTETGWLKAEDVRDIEDGYAALVGKSSSRNIAHILLPEDISIKEQKQIIDIFNREMFRLRKEYNSLFLTNFRDNDRKRVSFEFCYRMISFIHSSLDR